MYSGKIYVSIEKYDFHDNGHDNGQKSSFVILFLNCHAY